MKKTKRHTEGFDMTESPNGVRDAERQYRLRPGWESNRRKLNSAETHAFSLLVESELRRRAYRHSLPHLSDLLRLSSRAVFDPHMPGASVSSRGGVPAIVPPRCCAQREYSVLGR